MASKALGMHYVVTKWSLLMDSFVKSINAALLHIVTKITSVPTIPSSLKCAIQT